MFSFALWPSLLISSHFHSDSWPNCFSSEIGASANQIFIPDLKPLTSYTLRVLAVNPLGQSEASAAVSVRTEEEGKKPKFTTLPSLFPLSLWTHCLVHPLVHFSSSSASLTHFIASHCISQAKSPCLICSYYPLSFSLLLSLVVAPGNAPLGVRVEPLSSKSVRVKWKVRREKEKVSPLLSFTMSGVHCTKGTSSVHF